MTLEQAQNSLDLWQTAYDRVSRGESISMNGKSLTRSDADMCWTQINRLTRLIRNKRTRARGGSGGHSLADFGS